MTGALSGCRGKNEKRTRDRDPSDRAMIDHRLPPNGVRLSCGALKKDSFLNLRRAASFKRLLGSASKGFNSVALSLRASQVSIRQL